MRKRFTLSICALLCFQAAADASFDALPLAPAFAKASAGRQAKQEAPSDESRVVATSPRCRISGHLDFRYVHRAGAIEEARGTLNGTPGTLDDANYLGGSASVRLDVDLDDRIRAAVELERLPYSDGEALPFGSAAVEPVLDEAWVEIRGFLTERLTLRLGQFDFSYRPRPHGEPFFFDSDAESVFSGAAGRFVHATADRDLIASAGLRLQYDIAEIALAEFALVWRGETVPTPASADDVAALLYLNTLTGERTALFLLAMLAAGPGHGAEVWTVGLGANQYFGPLRQVEVFGEVYGQFGHLVNRVSKGAWGVHAGARYVVPDGPWGEVAVAYRSGDRRPSDSRDQAFQSAERVDRFLLVESAEFGLDWDTNIRAIQFAVGYPASPRVSLRADAGWFAFNEDLVDALGGVILDKGDNGIGFEIDGTVAVELNAQSSASLRLGWLRSTEVLEALTPGREHNAWVIVAGVSAAF